MSSKIQIVHVSEVLATGILTFINRLVTELDNYDHTIVFRIRNLGHDVEELVSLLPSNVNLIKWEKVNRSINPVGDFMAGVELYRILKKISPDILHLHSSKAGVLGRLVGPMVISKKKIIYTPNGASFSRIDISQFSKLMFKGIEKISDLIAGQVTCVSKSEYNNYTNLGITPVLINNGVKIGDKPKAKKIDNNSIINIVTVGRIVVQKNPARFNEIAMAFRDNPRIQFVWVGDGKKRSLLTSPNIKITGWIPQDKVDLILKESHVYLSTSDWEGLSFSTLEAMAVGLPLILSNCVGNVDLIIEGKTGFLYETNTQAIESINLFVNRSDDFHYDMAMNAYEYCEQNFSLNRMLNGYDALYAALHDDKVIINNSL